MASTCIDCNWERNWRKASNLLSDIWDIPRIASQKELSLWWSVCLQPRTQTLEHWNCSSIFVLWQKWEQLLDPKLQVLPWSLIEACFGHTRQNTVLLILAEQRQGMALERWYVFISGFPMIWSFLTSIAMIERGKRETAGVTASAAATAWKCTEHVLLWRSDSCIFLHGDSWTALAWDRCERESLSRVGQKFFMICCHHFWGENLKISQAMSYKTRKVHPSASQGKAEEQTSKEECLAGELHVSARIRLFFAFPQLVHQESETNCQTWIAKSARGRKADSTYL